MLLGDGWFSAKDFALANPPRIVVDLPGVKNEVKQRTIVVKDDVVTRVRISQFQTSPEFVTRVVVDLARPMPHALVPDGERLAVVVGENAAAETMAQVAEEPAVDAAGDRRRRPLRLRSKTPAAPVASAPRRPRRSRRSPRSRRRRWSPWRSRPRPRRPPRCSMSNRRLPKSSRPPQSCRLRLPPAPVAPAPAPAVIAAPVAEARPAGPQGAGVGQARAQPRRRALRGRGRAARPGSEQPAGRRRRLVPLPHHLRGPGPVHR